jgi:hypothetical protein
MTPLQPGRLLRLPVGGYPAALRGGTRLPTLRRVTHRVRIWDSMGYHGTIWASMELDPNGGSGRPPARPSCNGSLTVRRLKESLRECDGLGFAIATRGHRLTVNVQRRRSPIARHARVAERPPHLFTTRSYHPTRRRRARHIRSDTVDPTLCWPPYRASRAIRLRHSWCNAP